MGAGQLRLYFGAAPGVGKTYKMLEEGHRRLERGTDVVIGFVEAHGRKPTAALIEGIEIIPHATVIYQGAELEEMDLGAVLARRPQVALVDDLAHSNVPGSRHERRWQDIQELLDAGITVITTVNVQHLESLNDVVYEITGTPCETTLNASRTCTSNGLKAVLRRTCSASCSLAWERSHPLPGRSSGGRNRIETAGRTSTWANSLARGGQGTSVRTRP